MVAIFGKTVVKCSSSSTRHYVFFQVHGGHMSNAATATVTTKHHVVKQSSLDKGERAYWA